MKPFLVFMHGLGSSCDSFRPLLAELEGLKSTFDFLAPNLPGFGREPAPLKGQPVSIALFAKHIEQEIQRRSGGTSRSIHLIAHSMGGAVALELKQTALRIESFTNLEGNLENEPSATSVAVANTPRERFCTVGFEALMSRVRQSAQAGDLWAVDWLAGLERTTAEVFYDASVDLVRASKNAYVRYRDWSIPSLYVFGENTLPNSANLYARLKQEGKDVAIVPRAGHSMMVENPQGTAELIRRFLAEALNNSV